MNNRERIGLDKWITGGSDPGAEFEADEELYPCKQCKKSWPDSELTDDVCPDCLLVIDGIIHDAPDEWPVIEQRLDNGLNPEDLPF